jgi:hypothetical protein
MTIFRRQTATSSGNYYYITVECLNKHRKNKQLNNKHRLNLYKEEKPPPRPPRAAIYPTFRR